MPAQKPSSLSSSGLPRSRLEDRLAAFTPQLRAFVGRRVRCSATADDLTQDTLLKALQRLPGLRDTSRLDAWLYRVARNVLIDHYRRQRPATVLSADATLPEGRERPADLTAKVAVSARCYLGTLPGIYQEAVRLAEDEELSHAEVARRLGISLTAAKTRIRRGKLLIRAKLESCCRFEFDRWGRVIGYALRADCGGC